MALFYRATGRPNAILLGARVGNVDFVVPALYVSPSTLSRKLVILLYRVCCKYNVRHNMRYPWELVRCNRRGHTKIFRAAAAMRWLTIWTTAYGLPAILLADTGFSAASPDRPTLYSNRANCWNLCVLHFLAYQYLSSCCC